MRSQTFRPPISMPADGIRPRYWRHIRSQFRTRNSPGTMQHTVRPLCTGLAGGLVLVLALLLSSVTCHSAACRATGKVELTSADVHAARMQAKVEDGAFDFSSGSLAAARQCADLVNRLTSVSLGNIGIPGADEVLEALEEAVEEGVQETVEEACRYVAATGTNWVRSQISLVRTTANAQASELVQANVNVTNPNTSAILATYRNRLKQGLPTYADLPSLKDLQ